MSSLLSIRNIPVTNFHCDFRLTNTVLSLDFAQQYNLQNTDTIPLTILVNPSKALTFTVFAQTSQYCPTGTQLILSSDVQDAFLKSSALRHIEPALLPTSYSFRPLHRTYSTQSATDNHEKPGAAENPSIPNVTPSSVFPSCTPTPLNRQPQPGLNQQFHSLQVTPYFVRCSLVTISEDPDAPLSPKTQLFSMTALSSMASIPTAYFPFLKSVAFLHHIFSSECFVGSSEVHRGGLEWWCRREHKCRSENYPKNTGSKTITNPPPIQSESGIMR
ncbi:hypothetical protein K435DRAFT_800262 [Dendrothele bispora CBS 962.96]|uniref:Uncharacterized protein n=1 Tax=Dendrothele bispora (strain CBS 962.96) TaxID=1314807 RepID=A0A4S8LT82_DENBC|nr:hypothetical protein K435DRAFT_800262 [Dendrothele bispora CBS 962.96]